jgi:hypothetical protein
METLFALIIIALFIVDITALVIIFRARRSKTDREITKIEEQALKFNLVGDRLLLWSILWWIVYKTNIVF